MYVYIYIYTCICVCVYRPGALGLKLVRPVMDVATYPGSVREGDTPSSQLGGMRDAPIGVWGGAPRENAFLR